jgi:ABC-type lipoprotein release transport system permease subunit
VVAVALKNGGAYFVGRLMQAQLFNISPMDPVVLGLVAVTLLGVALFASVIPSWRATKIDPIVVLSK